MHHPLEGSRLKVGRAKSKIEFLREAGKTFAYQTRCEIVRTELNPKTGKYVYRLRTDSPPPPLEWGVDIGEIAHNLRSALDGLVTQLVLLAGEAPTRRNQFPICLTGRGKVIKPAFFRQRSDRLKGVLPEHQALIERLQPYKRGAGGRRNPLRILQVINDIDKHRLIHVAGIILGGVAYGGREAHKTAFVGSSTVLKDGAKILEAPAEVNVLPPMIPRIAFGRGCPRPIVGMEVDDTLQRILDYVSAILEIFAPVFPSQGPSHD